VLVRHEISDAVEVFVVSGAVLEADVERLRATLLEAVALHPRGVVVDLSAAGPFAGAALRMLDDVRRSAPGWPRPALVVCGAPPEVAAQLNLPVHDARTDALAHVDDRSAAPRRRFGVEHAVDSPCAARAAVARAAGDLEVESLSDDLQLVVSELVTNAIRYADPPVELEIEAGEDTVTIAVADGSAGRPEPKAPGLDAEGGRGLLLIDLLAAETGVRPEPPGKTIWASLQRTAPTE
jgi:anti-sigma regulatory factor (Ser/Thr protein kinase)